MESNLKVNIKETDEEMKEVELEPMSPTAKYFVSEVALSILAIFESEISIDISSIYPRLKDVFLPIHPRFSSIVIEDKKGKKMWKRVNVNVEDHVKVPKFPGNLSEECYTEHFDGYISTIAQEKLSQHKPLWEFHIFNYPTNNSAGVFIFKIHHAIADGVSLMGAVFSCLRRTSDPSLPLTFPSTNTAKKPRNKLSLLKCLGIVPKIVSSTFYSMQDFYQSLRLSFQEDSWTPIRSGNAGCDAHTFRLCTVTFSLEDVKRIKTYLKVTVNDVILGIIFFGCRLYMQEMNKGQLKKTRSTATVAVNIRSLRGYGYASPEEMRKNNSKVPWGNKVAILQLAIPNLHSYDLTNPVNFVVKAHKSIKHKRTSFAPFLMVAFLEAIKACGGIQVAGRIFGNRLSNSSLPTSSLIGPAEQMSLANHPIKGFYFMPVGVKKSVSISIMSYMQKIRIGLAVEDDFIDYQRLLKCMDGAFQLILQASTANQNGTTSSTS